MIGMPRQLQPKMRKEVVILLSYIGSSHDKAIKRRWEMACQRAFGDEPVQDEFIMLNKTF
jgi:hypothetical protein